MPLPFLKKRRKGEVSPVSSEKLEEFASEYPPLAQTPEMPSQEEGAPGESALPPEEAETLKKQVGYPEKYTPPLAPNLRMVNCNIGNVQSDKFKIFIPVDITPAVNALFNMRLSL